MTLDLRNLPNEWRERRKRKKDKRNRAAAENALGKGATANVTSVGDPGSYTLPTTPQQRMFSKAKGGTVGGGVANSGGKRRSTGQYLGDLGDYLGADLYQGATGQLFDPWWKRTEVATNKEAEQSGKLNSYEYAKMSELEAARKEGNDSIYKDNIERVAKGQPQLPYFQFPASPEWKTFYDTKTGKMDFVHTPLFSTLNEFDRASADLLVIQSKARELLTASGTPVNQQTMDNATRNFMADPKYYKEAGYSPYQISQAQNAYYTSKLGLPVPGKGAPWYQRAYMAYLYEAGFPSPQLMEAGMHRAGLSSWNDIRGNSDNPLDIIAGYVGGTAGFVTNLAMTGGVGGALKVGGKMFRANKLAPLALPFTASDEMFAGLSRQIMKKSPKFTPEMASTIFATPVRQGVGMGMMSAGLTAAEGGDAKEVLTSAGAGAVMGGAIGWLAPKAIAKLSGGAMGNTDGDFIHNIRYPVIKSSFTSLIQGGKEILSPLDKSGALVSESAYMDFVENADSAIKMLTKYGENKILNGIADKNVGVTPVQWIAQLRQRLSDGDPAAKESIVKIAKDLQHPDFIANFDSYFAPEGEMFAAQQMQEAFVNKIRKEKGMTLGQLSEEIAQRREGNEAYYAMERYAKDNGLTVQELKAKMTNGQYPSLPVINAMAKDLGISKQDARRLMYVAPDVSPREQEWMRLLAQIRPLEGGKIPFVTSQAEYEASQKAAGKFNATNDLGESKRNLAILTPYKSRVAQAHKAMLEAQADYEQTLAARKTMGGMLSAGQEEANAKTRLKNIASQELTVKYHKLRDTKYEYTKAVDAHGRKQAELSTNPEHQALAMMPARYPEGDPKQIIGSFAKFQSTMADADARTMTLEFLDKHLGFTDAKGGSPIISGGYMGEAQKSFQRINQLGTAVVDFTVASGKYDLPQKMTLIDLLTIPGKHQYSVLNGIFGSDYQFMKAKSMDAARVKVTNGYLEWWNDIVRRHKHENVERVWLKRRAGQAITGADRAIDAEIAQWELSKGQFTEGAEYIESYARKASATPTSVKLETGIFRDSPIEVSTIDPASLHRTGNKVDLLSMDDTIISQVDWTFKKVYGEALSQMFEKHFGTPDSTQKGVRETKEWLQWFIKDEFMGWNKAGSNTGWNKLFDNITALRYGHDLPLNISTHIKNLFQPVLKIDETGGLFNFLKTNGYHFDKNIQEVYNAHRGLMESNVLSDIMMSAERMHKMGGEVKKGGWHNYALEIANNSYNYVEMHNRFTAFVPALGKQLSNGFTEEEAIPRAVMDVLHGQWAYGKMGSPKVLRGSSAARMIFQYSFASRYLDRAVQVMNEGKWSQAITAATAAMFIDMVAKPLILHDKVYMTHVRKMVDGTGSWQDLDSLMGSGSLGGINDLSPITGIKPGATLQDMNSPWDLKNQVNTDFSQFNYTGRPFVEAMTDIARLFGGAPRKQTELKALMMRLKADPKNALTADYWADLLRNPSLGGMIPYGGQSAKSLSSLDRLGGEKNEMGDTVMRDNDFDPSKQGIVADLDPMEELMMLMLGNAPEVSEYYNLQKNKLTVNVLTASTRSDLQQKYEAGLTERMLGLNTGKWEIYSDAVMDALSKEPNNTQDLTTNEYSDLTQKSIESYEQDPAVIINAINGALRALPQGSKRRTELEKLLLDYQKLEVAEEEKGQKGSERNLRRAKGMGF